MGAMARALRQGAAGIRAGLAHRPGVFLAGTSLVAAASVVLPPALLSLARKPVDYVTVNPWLRRLPEYLATPDVPWATKLEKLWALAIVWCSADSPMGGTEWGFAVDVGDVVRILLTSALFGAYFALWIERRALLRAPAAMLAGAAAPGGGRSGRAGGVLGAVLSVSGLSTGPCSVMGCGAPVLPVVGLAFVGLSSGALRLLAQLATVATAAVLVALVLGVGHLGWSVGGLLRSGRPPMPGAATPR